MIDINNIGSDKIPDKDNPFWLKVVAGFAVLLLIVGLVWVLWYFLSPNRTIQIKEGQTYAYGGYVLKIEALSNSYCPGSTDSNCGHWLYEDGIKLSYIRTGSGGINFDYIGMDSKNQLSLPGLDIRLISVDFENRSSKLKLTK